MITMKVLRCRDIGMDCGWEGRAETENELLDKAAKHAADVHQKTEFSDEELAAVKAAIREE
jgi:predicted small metal-binding protein